MAMIEGAARPYLDTHTDAFLDNPNSHLAPLGGHDVITCGHATAEIFDHARVRALLMDPRLRPPTADFFAGRGAGPRAVAFIEDGLLLMMDPARHARLRRVLLRGFTARRVENARLMMRRLAHSLIDRCIDRRQSDIVGDFSHHFAIGVISRFIGVPPEDVPLFEHASVELRLLGAVPLAPVATRLDDALATIWDYSARLAQRRRASPQEDFVSDLVSAHEGDRLSDTELNWAIGNLLLAGHDTTRFQTASCVRAILEAGQWEHLARHPEEVDAAVMEGMRLYPVTARLSRLVTETIDLDGDPLPPGAHVLLNIGAAARDPRRYANPDCFDIRRDPPFDLVFGAGPHLCLGHALARLEIVEAIKALTTRLTGVRLGGAFERAPATATMIGPERLDIQFKARAA